jgi:hypothetical protein
VRSQGIEDALTFFKVAVALARDVLSGEVTPKAFLDLPQLPD